MAIYLCTIYDTIKDPSSSSFSAEHLKYLKEAITDISYSFCYSQIKTPSLDDMLYKVLKKIDNMITDKEIDKLILKNKVK